MYFGHLGIYIALNDAFKIITSPIYKLNMYDTV